MGQGGRRGQSDMPNETLRDFGAERGVTETREKEWMMRVY